MTSVIAAGSRLGPYEVTGALGAGGMGEVWRATDTRLGREVALKLLPEEFAEDPERHARFEREARTLAGLNHPNIATLYGLEHLPLDGARPPGAAADTAAPALHVLVMELVEGEGLDARIERGPLPLDEALAVAKQIAEALEAAHGHGIVHRDLKPANVKVRRDGTVKVLDFGLAKAWAEEADEASLSLSPTITQHHTRAGLILGTAGYMSPEQARGRPVDRRADVWAFGVVLWEMLSGERLFSGDTVSDTLAAVLRADPDPELLPAATPASLRRLLARCLERDPRARLHDIADVRILLEEAGEEPASAEAVPPPARRSRAAWLGWAVAAAALALVAVLGWRGRAPLTAPAVTRLVAPLPKGVRLALQDVPVLALSPDGREMVFSAMDPASGQPLVYLRRLDDPDIHPIRGTERGNAPFLSPDGRSVAFFADRELKKIQVSGGGAPFTLAEATSTRGGCWSPDGTTIYYSPQFSAGLWRVPAAGGTAEAVVEPDADKGERTFRWPQALPDGRTLLFTVGFANSPNNYDDAWLEAYSLDTKKRTVLIRGANMGRFAPPDHLVYSRAGVLYAVRFDPAALEVTGSPTPVLQGVGGDPSSGAGYFDLASDGTLAYLRGDLSDRNVYLSLVDRKGTSERLPLTPRGFGYPRFSPDGARIAMTIGVNPVGTDGDLWVFTPASGAMDRLTFTGNAVYPSWTPDGSRITYAEMQKQGLYLKAADGSGAPEELIHLKDPSLPESWSPDGRTLAFVRVANTTDIYLLTAGGTPRLFEKDASDPVFSPDGRWIAYSSPAAGESNVFVRPVEGDGKWQISPNGGGYARWPSPGDEIYYIAIGALERPVVSVHVAPGRGFQPSPPKQVIPSTAGYAVTSTAPSVNWDAAPGGTRFVFTEQQHDARFDTTIEIALNWVQGLGDKRQ